MTPSRRDFLRLSLAGAAVPLVATACAPGTSGSAASSSSSAGAAVSTDGAAMGDVSLTMLDSWVESAAPLQNKAINAVNAAFTKKYPNIKITRKSLTFDEMNKTLKLSLSGDTAPDIAPANNGWQGIGQFAKSKLILDLEPYAKAYGWADRFPETLARQHQVTADGSQIGTGNFFGVPVAQGVFISIFYNRAKLAKLGEKVPTTMAEIDALLAKAKAAGEVPMMIGTQDQWLATTTLFALMNVYADKKAIGDFVYGIGGTAADTGMKQAAQTYQKWATSGYLPKNFAGIPGADSGQSFTEGTGLMYVYYSDSLPFKTTLDADKFGAFFLPSPGAVQATGAGSQNLSIAARCKNPDAAALYLDFVSSKEAGDISLATGLTPLMGTYQPTSSTGPMLTDEIGQLNALQGSDGFVPYFDWASPTMLDTLGAQCQLLMAGKITPDQIVEACQKDYDAFRKTQGK